VLRSAPRWLSGASVAVFLVLTGCTATSTRGSGPVTAVGSESSTPVGASAGPSRSGGLAISADTELDIRPVAATALVSAGVPANSSSLPVKGTSASADQTSPTAAENAAYEAIDCSLPKNQTGTDAGPPTSYLIACGYQSGAWSKYLLAPVLISSGQIASATAEQPFDGAGWQVDLVFAAAAVPVWASYTAANAGTGEIAYVVSGGVLGAVTIQAAILTGQSEIFGNFTKASAEQLARSITRGSNAARTKATAVPSRS
jgi:preprotein translocase subunit SecD